VVLYKLYTEFVGDHALMAESPTFYNAFGPCMARLKDFETHKNGRLKAITGSPIPT
jgi:hypothetical protein